MKFTLALLLLSLSASAQDSTLYARASLTERIALTRRPLATTKTPGLRLADPQRAGKLMRGAGWCFLAGIGLGLAGTAAGALAQDNGDENAVLYPFVGAVAGLAFTVAGGLNLIAAGKALGRP